MSRGRDNAPPLWLVADKTRVGAIPQPALSVDCCKQLQQLKAHCFFVHPHTVSVALYVGHLTSNHIFADFLLCTHRFEARLPGHSVDDLL